MIRFIAFVVLFLAFAPMAQAKAVYTNSHGLALSGYDVVSYHGLSARQSPLKGSPQYQARYNGATYYFASSENLQAFQREPLYYLPQYGGHCAYGVFQGARLGGDPLAWSIYKEKLYLNYNKTVRGLWSQGTESYILSANENWPRVREMELP